MNSRPMDDGSRKAEVLDAAIDDAVREMMHVEPRADLRARVIAHIERPRRAFKWTGMLVPLAAAALLIVAIALRQPTVTPAPKVASDIVLPAPRTELSTTVVRREKPRRPAAIASAVPRNRRIDAAVAADDTRFSVSRPPGFAAVDALEPPPPITIDRISPVMPPVAPDIEVPPLRVPALEVSALPDSPRERHDEE